MQNSTDISLNIPETGKPRVIIIGGGFGGLNAVKYLPGKFFQVVMFDKHNYHTFQPLLYQVATAGLEPDSIAAPLRKEFAKKIDFHFRMLKVLSINPDENKISTIAGDLKYDYLVIATGTKANFFGNEMIKKFSFPLKTIPNALDLRSQLMQVFERATITTDADTRRRLMNIVLVGGGPTGVEMAGALAELRKHVLPEDFPGLDFTEMKIWLIEGSHMLLAAMSEKSGAAAKKYLEKMGIIIKINTVVEAYDGNEITLRGGEKIPAQIVIWSAGVIGDMAAGMKPEWIEKNRLLTDEQCRVKGSANIFAVGDIALMKSTDHPKGHPGVAQVAIQMGKYIGKNLQKIHKRIPVRPFRYFNKGSLATIGRAKAVADLPGNINFAGRLAWFIWLYVHVSFLISFRNKLLVLASWVWSYFTYDKGNRLIIRPYIRKDDVTGQEIVTVNESE